MQSDILFEIASEQGVDELRKILDSILSVKIPWNN